MEAIAARAAPAPKSRRRRTTWTPSSRGCRLSHTGTAVPREARWTPSSPSGGRKPRGSDLARLGFTAARCVSRHPPSRPHDLWPPQPRASRGGKPRPRPDTPRRCAERERAAERLLRLLRAPVRLPLLPHRDHLGELGQRQGGLERPPDHDQPDDRRRGTGVPPPFHRHRRSGELRRRTPLPGAPDEHRPGDARRDRPQHGARAGQVRGRGRLPGSRRPQPDRPGGGGGGPRGGGPGRGGGSVEPLGVPDRRGSGDRRRDDRAPHQSGRWVLGLPGDPRLAGPVLGRH